MWDVIVRDELRHLIDDAERHKTAYPAAYEQLRRDPCLIFDGSARPFACRLTGPLGDKVCGVKLKNKYRLAFTMRPAEDAGHDGIVDVLYVGPRETRNRTHRDIWEIVHDLFGVANPPAGHLKDPCCKSGLPDIDPDELDEFMARLRKFLRAALVVDGVRGHRVRHPARTWSSGHRPISLELVQEPCSAHRYRQAPRAIRGLLEEAYRRRSLARSPLAARSP